MHACDPLPSMQIVRRGWVERRDVTSLSASHKSIFLKELLFISAYVLLRHRSSPSMKGVSGESAPSRSDVACGRRKTATGVAVSGWSLLTSFVSSARCH